MLIFAGFVFQIPSQETFTLDFTGPLQKAKSPSIPSSPEDFSLNDMFDGEFIMYASFSSIALCIYIPVDSFYWTYFFIPLFSCSGKEVKRTYGSGTRERARRKPAAKKRRSAPAAPSHDLQQQQQQQQQQQHQSQLLDLNAGDSTGLTGAGDGSALAPALNRCVGCSFEPYVCGCACGVWPCMCVCSLIQLFLA